MFAALEAAYVGICNAYLESQRLRRLAVSRPDKVLVEWDHAWTWWPGVVHVRGIQVRAQSRKAQWLASVDRATVALRILPIAWRHFHATSFSGSGVRFWLRLRETDDPQAAREAPSWPTIPGFAPDLGPKTEPPPLPRHLWTISVDRSRLEHVKDVWIDSLRLRGDATATGSIKTRIRDWVELPDATLRVASARIESGPHLVSEALAVDGAVRFERFATSGATPQKVWSGVSGAIRAEGPIASFAVLDRFFESAPWTRLEGSGETAIDLHVDRGLLAPGTMIATEDAKVALRIWEQEIRGTASVLGTVAQGEPPRARLLVTIREFDLLRGENTPPYAHGEGFRFAAEREGTEFRDRDAPLHLRIDLPESQVAHFEVYNAYLPKSAGLVLRSGTGTVGGFLEMSTDTMTGRGAMQFVGQDLAGAYGDLHIRGNATLAFELAPLPPQGAPREAPAFALKGGRLEVSGAHTGEPRRNDPGWWARLAFGEGTLAINPYGISGNFRADLLDTSPMAAILIEKSKWFALLRQVLIVEDVRARGALRMEGDRLTVHGLDVTGEEMELQADLDFAPDGKTGLLFARKGVFRIAVAMEPGGHRDWKLVNAREWFEARRRSYSDRR